jgi:uncharacterized iron-regulated membrane protein
MSLKKVVNRIHLVLGLASGFLVFVLAITGSILVFQSDIEDATQDFRFVARQEKPVLPPSALIEIAQKAMPGKMIHSIGYEEGRSVNVSYYHEDPDYWYDAYLDPYTGKVLHVKNSYTDFFGTLYAGHYRLWLPLHIGKPIASTATLIFIVMIVTGIVQWWPKKNNVNQRFKIKLSSRWRRKNYDLHYVVGFYVSIIGLFIAITGSVMGFQWFEQSYMWTISAGKSNQIWSIPPSDEKTKLDNVSVHNNIDIIWKRLVSEYPQAKKIEVHVPEDDIMAIEASANISDLSWQADVIWFDQYTLKEIPVNHPWRRQSELSGAEKFRRMNFEMHTGMLFGLPGKLIFFFSALIIASLPITGFMIWWGRRNKAKKAEAFVQASKQVVSVMAVNKRIQEPVIDK